MKPTFLHFLFIILVLVPISGCQDVLDVQENMRTENQPCLETNASPVVYENHSFFTESAEEIENAISRNSNNQVLARTFVVTAPERGCYYLNAHVLPNGIKINGNSLINDIDVYVNGAYCGKLNLTKLEWEFATIKDTPQITLNQGVNYIQFKNEGLYYPEIDAIEIENDISNLMVEDSRFEEYLQFLKTNGTLKLANEANKSRASIGSDLSVVPWQVVPYELENPDGDYIHLKDVPVTYTYHRLLYLTKGDYVFNAESCQENEDVVHAVLCLYNIEEPKDNSFYSYRPNSGMARLGVSITKPGNYYLIAHAPSNEYSNTVSGRMGLVNVYQDGILINTSMPVAGYSVNMTTNKTGNLNFFTANSTGRTCFFLEDVKTKKIYFGGDIGYYVNGMDFSWIYEARTLLKKPTTDYNFNMIVTAENALLVNSGKCDVYGNCSSVEPTDYIMRSFPNLKSADAMYSGISDNNVYNCASWAGGLTNVWTWGNRYSLDDGSISLNPTLNPYVWETWDNFFGNNPPRYNGATTYTRENANENNASIAVWSKSSSINNVTHFSVRGDANKHPHGYDWESKPGSLRRIFHPKDALRGTSYGSIIAYYCIKKKYVVVPNSMRTKEIDANVLEKISTLEESINAGLTVVEEVNLSSNELFAIEQVKSRISDYSTTYSEFSRLYELWQRSINSPNMQIISNPYELISTKEGIALIEYGRQHRSIALAFFSKLYFSKYTDTTTELSYLIFCQIFEEYSNILNGIKQEWNSNRYNSDGAYIAPMPELFIKKFVKRLIKDLYE